MSNRAPVIGIYENNELIGVQGQDFDDPLLNVAGGPAVLGSALSAGLVVLSQSVELGTVVEVGTDGVTQKICFNAPAANYYEGKDPCAWAGAGSPITVAVQDLAREIQLHYSNCSQGSIGNAADIVGIQYIGWQPNMEPRGLRASLGDGDPGHKGFFFYENGGLWEVTTGNPELAFCDSKTGITFNGTTYYRDLSALKRLDPAARRRGGNVKPVFPAAAVGALCQDNGAGSANGGLEFTCRAVVAAPAADAGFIRLARKTDLAFDPHGFAGRGRGASLAQPVPANMRHILMMGSQTDSTLNSDPLVALARVLLTSYFADVGIITIHGASIYSSALGLAAYNTVERALWGADLDQPVSDATQAASQLATRMTAAGFSRAVPGTTARSATRYHVIPTLGRLLGTGVELQADGTHATRNTAYKAGKALVPYLRSILLNKAQ